MPIGRKGGANVAQERIVILGGHGKIALLAAPKLVAAGYSVESVIRNPEQSPAVEAAHHNIVAGGSRFRGAAGEWPDATLRKGGIMHAVVVYESLWGNTEQLAREIAAGIGERTDVVDAASAQSALDADVDLLVVGGPTHAFSMTTGSTREAAKQQGAERIPSRGIREWIQAQTSPGSAVPVATFDTRVVSPRLPGSAAKKAMKRLVALGFRPVAKPETFGVHGYTGPVADGELERARNWGADLATLLPTLS